MTKSMACPFCGMRDEACYVNGLNGAKVYQCQWCGAQALCQEDWETRPLEESLRDKNEILQSKLARWHQVSDALYLLLVDDPNTKLQADQILINIFGKCEPSPSDVSMTQDVLTTIKTEGMFIVCQKCKGLIPPQAEKHIFNFCPACGRRIVRRI